MKKNMFVLLAVFAVSLIACNNEEPQKPQEASIVGHWDLNYLLVNTIEDMDMKSEKVFYPGYMDIYENNTLMFALYDVSDKNWGQWLQNDNQFIVSLEIDNSIVKQSFKIEKLTQTELVLKRKIIDDDNIEIGTYDYYCVRK
ncbi:MAG: hypothetical protein II551_00825 [Paludibacteraceae bacterium]|nr:hypothetical protein [Paludibacteraceae bacterium]